MKTNLLYLVLLLMIISLNSVAQDSSLPRGNSVIYFNSGKTIKDAVIWKIDSLNIEFVKFGNLSDVRTSDVSKIVFSDGSVKDFNKTLQPENKISTSNGLLHKQDTIILSPIVGTIIDKKEKIKYNLFPYYSSEQFINAVFILNSDSSIVLKVLLEPNITGEKPITLIEYNNTKYLIDGSNDLSSEIVIEKKPSKPIKEIFVFKQNFISVNSTDLILGLITFNYEYTFKTGKISIKFPLSFGSKSPTAPNYAYENYGNLGYYNKNKTFSTGIELHFFPAGQRKACYFNGPVLEYGRYNYSNQIQNINYVSNPYPYTYNTYTYEKKSGSYYALLFQHGFLFQPTIHFCMSVNIGMGFSKYNNMLNQYNLLGGITARAGFNIGYKF